MLRMLLTFITVLMPMTLIANDAYESRSIEYTGGPYEKEKFKYRLMKPAKLEEEKRYPLIVFLHGAGERGTDNEKQLYYLPTLMAGKERREQYPCFLLAPQCRSGKQWVDVPWSDKKSSPMAKEPTHQLRVALQMVEQTLKDEAVDVDRVYLTGLSMGGFGSWELAMRHPKMFAALAPVCGGGDDNQAARLKSIPTWAFHGGADNVVHPERSSRLVETLRKIGGDVKYTEYPGVGHNSWNKAYADDDFFAWLFKQHRK